MRKRRPTNTWGRRLRRVSAPDALCAPMGRTSPCDNTPTHELTYWSPQGQSRTPAKSTRLLCDYHVHSYIALHHGAVEIAA